MFDIGVPYQICRIKICEPAYIPDLLILYYETAFVSKKCFVFPIVFLYDLVPLQRSDRTGVLLIQMADDQIKTENNTYGIKV